MTLKVRKLAYVRVQVPDFDEAERFFTAFGLRRVNKSPACRERIRNLSRTATGTASSEAEDGYNGIHSVAFVINQWPEAA